MPEERDENTKNNQTQMVELADIDQPGTDSVTEDINKFKESLTKLKQGVGQKVKPVVNKVQTKVEEKTPPSVKEKFTKRSKYGWIKFLFVPVFILFVALIMYSLARNGTDRGGEEVTPTPTVFQSPTPTIIPVGTVRQSVYSDDVEIQELQKQLDIIYNEMFTMPLRDSTLNPPVLDFNIEFK